MTVPVGHFVAVPQRQTLFAKLPQVLGIRFVVRRGEDGVMGSAQVEVDVDAIGDFQSPGNGVRLIAERRVHLLRGLHIELVPLHPHPFYIAAHRTRVDTQKHVVSRRIFSVQIMSVIGGHHGQAHPVGQIGGRIQTHLLNLETCVLDLQIVPIAEELLVPGDHFLRPIHLVLDDQLRQLTARASGQADEPLVELSQQFLVDARFVIEALQIGGRRQLDEVPKAGPIHGQQRQVETGLLHPRCRAVGAASRSDVRFVAQYRLDTLALARIVEIDGPVQVPVIGDGNSLGPVGFDLGDQIGDPIRSVQETEMRVTVKMDEWARSTHRNSFAPSRVGPS